MWVAQGGSTETETITIVENIFEHNDIIEAPDGDMYFEPEFEEQIWKCLTRLLK